MSLEFGTLSPLKVFGALPPEDWLHHHGDSTHPKTARIEQQLLRAFHPDDVAWETQVFSAGSEFVKNTLTWAKPLGLRRSVLFLARVCAERGERGNRRKAGGRWADMGR